MNSNRAPPCQSEGAYEDSRKASEGIALLAAGFFLGVAEIF